MFSAIFDIWHDLPVILRVGLSLILIGITVLTIFVGDRIWVLPGAIGLVLLLFAGSGKNKNGYNF